MELLQGPRRQRTTNLREDRSSLLSDHPQGCTAVLGPLVANASGVWWKGPIIKGMRLQLNACCACSEQTIDRSRKLICLVHAELGCHCEGAGA